jgi:hypothetical protein
MKTKKWTGFLTSLLGVILGILLTFGVNSLWHKREETKKTREMLILIRNELETNKRWFKNHERLMMKDRYVYTKIAEIKETKTPLKSIPVDTLKKWHTQMLSWSDYQLTASSWQIFQNSEMIQKMSNRELVIRLTDCYFIINKVRDVIMTEYWDKKKKTNNFDFDPYRFFDSVMKDKESVFFFYIWSVSMEQNNFWMMFPTVDAIIDYTISLLDKDGDYRYNMEEKDKEIDDFINARIDSVYQKRTDNENH